jgi:membrane protease YdiL (CAAX protease family)
LKKKYNLLLIDNPLDIASTIFLVVALVNLVAQMNTYAGSVENPDIYGDCLQLIIWGTLGFGGMITIRLIFHTEKANHTPLFANMFNKAQIWDLIYCMACYVGIQLVVIVIQQTGMFQVAEVDVYFFFFDAAVVEEHLYRGFIVMLSQFLLAKIFKPKMEKDMLIINIISAVVSGGVFMAVHTNYWGNMLLMILTFTGGASQAFWYAKTKNLLIPIGAHVLINLSASRTLVATLKSQGQIS